MQLKSIPPGSVAVGLDGSPWSARALAVAIDQASAERRTLILVHALGSARTSRSSRGNGDSRGVLADARVEVKRRAPHLEVHELPREGDPREVLLAVAEWAGLLVVGSRGRGPVRRLLLGSVGIAVIRHARCPVIVVRQTHPGKVRQGVLVGVDGTERSRAPLDFAFRQASMFHLPLTVLHVFWDEQARVGAPHAVDPLATDVDEQRLLLAETVSGMREEFPDVRVHTELARGQRDTCLVERAERMNLLVVGTHNGDTFDEMMFGSVATSAAEHAACAVAVVPVGPRG